VLKKCLLSLRKMNVCGNIYNIYIWRKVGVEKKALMEKQEPRILSITLQTETVRSDQ
jgi:hypothetical protein